MVFSDTLRLSVKPACFFSKALSHAIAEKPTADYCHDLLVQKEMQKRHEQEVTLPTQLQKLAASNYQNTLLSQHSRGTTASNLAG